MRPLFLQIDEDEMTNYFYYHQRLKALHVAELLPRLQRIYQNYKTAYWLNNNCVKADDLLQQMFTVDTSHMDYIQSSFSFLHWVLIE